MRDESDVAQARVFYELLGARADELTAAIRATATRRGLARSTTEGRRLERELQEIRRYLDRLRDRFPELADRGA